VVRTAGKWLDDLYRAWPRDRTPPRPAEEPGDGRRNSFLAPAAYRPLKCVTLTDEVGRTLFDEYAAHLKGDRGEEETGWLLLGLRQEDEAVALATLPAGTRREAGVAHVRFSSSGQVLGSRIVRQLDRRLTPLGVVHTHPGSLRHPSDGDYRGDNQWVAHLRGQEGVFGIGTADAKRGNGTVFGAQPKPHVQCLGDLCLSWYSLRKGDTNYRPLPYGLTLGPDLARPLHPLWATLEAHAEELDRLFRQQSRVTFEVAAGERGPALTVTISLAEPGRAVRVQLEDDEVRYFLSRDGDLLEADVGETRVDRGVYLLLAELAARC
jgi:proteasome lid subunit RPN8/RPN11